MTFDESEGVLTQLIYKGKTIKIIGSAVAEESVRILDTAALTDVEYTMAVSAPIMARLERMGNQAVFLFAMQLLGVMLIDAKDFDPNN